MCDQRTAELEIRDEDVRWAENRLRLTMGELPACITVSSSWAYIIDPENLPEGFPFDNSLTRAEEDDGRFWNAVRSYLRSRGAVYITLHGTLIEGATPAVLWYGVMLCYGKLFAVHRGQSARADRQARAGGRP